MRMTVLQPGDILTSIRIPSTWAGQRFYFEKSRDRAVWDFPLANVASAAKITNGVIEDIRIVANGVAPYPVRFTAAEDAVRGEAVSEETADRAAAIAIRGVGLSRTMATRWRCCAAWSSGPYAAPRYR